MRLVSFTFALALMACGPEARPKLPQIERFYFPTGVVHRDASGGGAGTLYVASSDFDKRYDYGAITAVDLDVVGLPVPSYLGGTAGPDYPQLSQREIVNLGISEEQRVLIAPFAGQMASWTMPDGRVRLFVPSRGEGDQLFAVDADGARLSCVGGDSSDCTLSAPSLTRQAMEAGQRGANGFSAGKPRAPQPYAVAVQDSGRRVLVTHLEQADSPLGSRDNTESYLVVTSADDPSISANSFISIGAPPSGGIAVGTRYAYLSGRQYPVDRPGIVPPAIRVVDLSSAARAPLVAQAEQQFRSSDMRDVVVSADERRLFLVTRAPDELLVLEISNPLSDAPGLALVGNIPLPAGPDQARLIPREAGRGSLVAVSCSTADSVAFYDDETGDLATVVSGLGFQPFGLAVQAPATCTAKPCGARVFVTHFGDGRVSVIDIKDVDAPADANVIAVLGQAQECLTDPNSPTSCPGVLK